MSKIREYCERYAETIFIRTCVNKKWGQLQPSRIAA